MKILVPIKRVPDPYAKLSTLSDGSGLDTTGIKWDINPFDEIALEAAVRLRESGAEAEIVVISIGPPEAEDQLRKALAMGADRAVLIETSGPGDPTAIAETLASFALEFGPDLILMGKQATDADHNETGQRLAERLDWPQITFAAKISVVGNLVSVTRETDTGESTVEAELPVLVTCDLRLAEPRYIALPGIIKARSKPLERRSATLAESVIVTVGMKPAPARATGKKVASVDDLIGALRAQGAL